MTKIYEALCRRFCTLVSRVIEHSEITERLKKPKEELIVHHLFYTTSIVINDRTPNIFPHYVNSQKCLTIKYTEIGGFKRPRWYMTNVIWVHLPTDKQPTIYS